MREVAASQLLIRAKSAQSYENDVANMVNSSNTILKGGIVANGEMMGRMKPYTSLKLYQDALLNKVLARKPRSTTSLMKIDPQVGLLAKRG